MVRGPRGDGDDPEGAVRHTEGERTVENEEAGNRDVVGKPESLPWRDREAEGAGVPFLGKARIQSTPRFLASDRHGQRRG